MKGQYPSISYALFFVISVIVLSIVMLMMNSLTDSVQKNYARGQMNYIAESIRNDVLKLYSTNAQGKFEMSIPNYVVGKQYMIEFDQNKLRLTLDNRGNIIEVERYINITASLSGRSYSPASIELERTGGNTFIRLVQ